MKRCPQCNRVESDNTLAFCRVDGIALINESGSVSEDIGTVRFDSSVVASESRTTALPQNLTNPDVSAPTTVLPSQPRPSNTRELRKSKRWPLITALALVVVIAVVASSYVYWSRANKTKAINSIAVMPFVNESRNADNEYLSDGLTDSLIYRLAQLPNLKVSPTSSVMRYKSKETDTAKIARELGVDGVMNGRVAQVGDKLNISVQLIDARTDKLIWAEQYDRTIADLLMTQREIAAAITDKLQLKLSGDEKGLTKKYTNNNEAYQLYLKGRYHFAKRSKEDVFKSIDYYQLAIKLDPNFALAYARIAEAYTVAPMYPYLSPEEAMPRAKAAATKSMEIDPTLSEAYAALGNVLTSGEWNWPESERAFKRAIELDPNSASAHYRYGSEYLFSVGRYDEAITEVKRALEIEPLDLNMNAGLARAYLYAGQIDQAFEQAKKAHDLEPSFVIGQLVLGMTYCEKGLYNDAIKLSENSLQANPTNQQMLRIRGLAYAMSGQRREAEETINRFRELSKGGYIIRSFVAAIYGALGDKDKAFAELTQAVEEREPWLKWISAEAMFDPIRDDPRFKDVLRRMNLPV